jgi:hypothetical protein
LTFFSIHFPTLMIILTLHSHSQVNSTSGKCDKPLRITVTSYHVVSSLSIYSNLCWNLHLKWWRTVLFSVLKIIDE